MTSTRTSSRLSTILIVLITALVISILVTILWAGVFVPTRAQPFQVIPTVLAFTMVISLLISAPPTTVITSAIRMIGFSIPFAGAAIAMVTDPERAHAWTILGELGPLLAAGSLGVVVVAVRSSRFKTPAIAMTFGGAAGIGTTIIFLLLVNTPASHGALAAGWAIGAAIALVIMTVPMARHEHVLGGLPTRILPTMLAWVVALAASVPSRVRHELSSSDGALALAIAITVCVIAFVVLLWTASIGSGPQPYLYRVKSRYQKLSPFLMYVCLLGIGVLQAMSYSSVAIDDLGRYWSIADSLTNGIGYDIWEAGASTAQGIEGSQWMDLPTLPILMIGTFALTGHTYASALLPMAIANTLLPTLTFMTTRALGVSISMAFSAAVLLTVMPTFQIYSLGAAEPDPIFAALVMGLAWTYTRALEHSSGRRWLLLGLVAALLALTRPEGPLYAMTLVLFGVASTRSIRTFAAVTVPLTALVVPFVLMSLASVGRPWPQAPQGLGLDSLMQNVLVATDHVWEFLARVLLLNDVRFPIFTCVLFGAFILGAWALTARRRAFGALPLAVIGNLVITLSIRPLALSPDEPQEFLRHVGPAFPIFVVVVTYGVHAATKNLTARFPISSPGTTALGLAAAIYFTVGSLYLLATPEEFHHGNRSGSLLRSDIYVNADKLWAHPITLPCPPCTESGQWDFLTFRRELFDHYRTYDAHSSSDGAAYQTLTGLLAALGLTAALATASRPRGPIGPDGHERETQSLPNEAPTLIPQ
jgi:hypothetical protein